MKLLNCLKHKLIIGSFLSFFVASHASAFLVEDTVLVGDGGLINLTEQNFNEGDFGGAGVRYALDILDESSALGVAAFAVSSNLNPANLTVTRTGWVGSVIDDSTWDSGFTINAFHTDINTAEIGSFSSFFGEDDFTYVFMMPAASVDNSITAASDELFEYIAFQTIGFSDFVAFDASGAIIERSLAASGGSTAVPEPSSLAIFALGLLGVGLRRYKK